MLILLIVLLLLFGFGGGTYNRWGTGGPAWGGNVLYVLAMVALVLLIFSFFMPGRFVL